MRIRTVSSPSFSSFPRNGTLMSPRATCRITGCPTQALNALSILVGPLTNQPDGRENGAAHRRSQWYREGIGVVSWYCLGSRRESGQRFHGSTEVPLFRDVRTIG